MIFQEIVDRCEQKIPIAMMVRAGLENIFAAERLDELFDATALRQENKKLMFSTLVDVMGLVACRIHPSPHAAYQSRKAEIGVTAKAFYDKLQRLEPDISRVMVRETGLRIEAVVRSMGGEREPVIPGYRTKILDGNHLRRTQRRIHELSHINGAPLPGHCVVVLDPQLKLAIDVFPCEDGHAQERSLLPEVQKTVQPGDLWIGDRNFCTLAFMFGIADRQAFFILRYHANIKNYKALGVRRKIGTCETGVVYEQPIRIFLSEERSMDLRAISIHLKTPARDGDQVICVWTNLPPRVSAITIAHAYRKRWTIETAFQEVAQNLEAEIETLGYPRAALFAFCVALVCHNVISLILAALRVVHGEETIAKKVSFYYLADEVAHTVRGVDAVFPESYWTRYAKMTPRQLGQELIRMAKKINLERYQKHPRGPKKPKKQMNKKNRGHVSTARILIGSRSATYG